MAEIGFIYMLQGQRRRLLISGPHGASMFFYVTADKYLIGYLRKQEGDWQLTDHKNNPLDPIDGKAFGNIIEHGLPPGTVYAFDIDLFYQGRSIPVPVEMELNPEFALYRVKGRRNTLVLRNNMPMLKTKGLKKKPPTWSQLAGLINDARALEKIKELLESHTRAILK